MRFERDLGDLLGILEEGKVEHMLVGGLAAEAMGFPRATFDIDIQVVAPAAPLRGKSVVFGCIVEEWARDPVFEQDTLIAHLPSSPIPVEFFFTTHWLPAEAVRRRQMVDVPALGRQVPVPTPEDFILLKSGFWTSSARRDTKKAQDALDIEAVARRGGLDLAYVERQAARLGVWDRLAPLLRQGEPAT
ncbi:MAG TPA: nucleotidyl transferase AbiEii/AbiGii toxin family protein [Candidatus Thermoplasmatota archaeon]|nr:nucleotidyl transferase AbiEii/AbiGii toxin family protein [Candidatus Thermoplasmatota archaeon]